MGGLVISSSSTTLDRPHGTLVSCSAKSLCDSTQRQVMRICRSHRLPDEQSNVPRDYLADHVDHRGRVTQPHSALSIH